MKQAEVNKHGAKQTPILRSRLHIRYRAKHQPRSGQFEGDKRHSGEPFAKLVKLDSPSNGIKEQCDHYGKQGYWQLHERPD